LQETFAEKSVMFFKRTDRQKQTLTLLLTDINTPSPAMEWNGSKTFV